MASFPIGRTDMWMWVWIHFLNDTGFTMRGKREGLRSSSATSTMNGNDNAGSYDY